MTDRHEIELDAALDALAADVAAASPRPGTDVMARVLADAAAIAPAATAAPVVELRDPANATASGFSLRELFFGWAAGATAAATLALVVGISVGMQVDTGLPLMAEDEVSETGLFAENGFLPDDIL